MKTTSRPRDIGESFASRRGHAPQISISDSSHHVTEAIGDMYGDDDYSKRDSRPLSFVASPLHDSIESSGFVASPLHESVEVGNTYFEGNDGPRTRLSPHINGNIGGKAYTIPAMLKSPKSTSFNKGDLSPSLSLRDHSGSDANSQFPLSNIDYESDPAAVAQEMSNLQALRRMSMDVGNTSDPDLPSFQSSLMPSIAPTGDDDEDDPSRLFWVPARVHPELAPMEFKTFLENRVHSIKHRSGEQTSLSPSGMERAGSVGGLRRKKSMLSKQIDTDGGRGALGYKDGADQLERMKSLSEHQIPELKIADLQELDALVRDPSKAMRKLSLETNLRRDSNGEVVEVEDMPILPQAPGIGLRRSTRTTYRRGSLRKEGLGPRRAGTMRADADAEESPIASSPIGVPLTKVQSEPTTAENFSRPNRGARRLQNIAQPSSHHDSPENNTVDSGKLDFISMDTAEPGQNETQIASYSGDEALSRNDTPVPRIIETPPPAEEGSQTPVKPIVQFPERSSSQGSPPLQQKNSSSPEPPARSSRRPMVDRQTPSSNVLQKRTSSQTLNDMAQNPSPLPGSNARTDTLTFIPAADDRKSEKKSKKDKDEPETSGTRKTSWGWFKGGDEKDKKEKKKEEDHKDSKRGKGKAVVDKAHDTARLDVLQATLDTGAPRGRESLLMDRDNADYKSYDEKKKDSSRKSGTENKKEKDSLFSSFFGGGRKKSDRDSGGKKGSSLRTLSPEPPPRQLKPDIDYNWTRFSILEERAIYRMAHIKLANPRRALYSQVLLSNFMYSYLAKVQQMHPQMQIPQSALQKKQEADRKQKEQEQQRQQQEGGEQYRYDYHQGITQYAESTEEPANAKTDGVEYVDDSQIYDYDHQDSSSSQGQQSSRPESRASQHDQEHGHGNQGQYERNGKDYYSFDRTEKRQKQKPDDDDDDMW
ncbi:related to SNF5-component of SWI/SNF transcription activator complex [Rhynchosporium secalis]|uniref:Related to SNF5-component of SWI/SNF transcription activator complex n=1 Tax=Rhynchosporium secalis TaxID=38038 RepID=A0A1E1MBA6_RHYSE|nr:related to SNF5-component of SWI/SNF transcription activator complex [Rhynchosporium secalis]